jgi:hypothetical protein
MVWADDDSRTDKEWEVDAGPTTLRIWTREQHTMLDCIFITDNLSSNEAEVNPRVPTDKDRAAQPAQPEKPVVTGVEIVLEAELAQVIEAPMIIAVPEDAPDQGGPEPDEPSNGQFIWSNTSYEGFAEFAIDIPKAGTYAIWARVIAWSGSNDSFYCTWLPMDSDENLSQTRNNNYRWSVANGNTWQWDRIMVWADDDSRTDKEWNVPAGPTTLRIWSRESNTMLDCLYITDDIIGGQMNVRVPTDRDRKIQVEGPGFSVEPAGKLPTTWGNIRSHLRD